MKERNKTIAEITIEDHHECFSATEFAMFLLYFRDVYHIMERIGPSAVKDVVFKMHHESPESHYNSIWKNVSPELAFRALRPYPHPRHLMEPIWPDDRLTKDSLLIEKISKNSPLEITLCGISIALSVAVVISGGSIEISDKGIKCKLPPLGVGISKLKKALNEKFRES